MSQLTPSELITRLTSWFLRRDRDITLPSGRKIAVDTANIEISNGNLTITTGNITITGTVDGIDISAHAADTDAHHTEAHTLASHSGQLDHDTDLSNVSADDHHTESHTVASHSDTTGTGAELNTLTDGSDASSLHDHDGRYFQESEFASDTGATSKPLETDSSGVLKTQYFLAWVDIAAVSGIMVGGQGVTPGGGRIMMKETSAPGTPASGWGVAWFSTSGDFWVKNDSGTATNLTP